MFLSLIFFSVFFVYLEKLLFETIMTWLSNSVSVNKIVLCDINREKKSIALIYLS